MSFVHRDVDVDQAIRRYEAGESFDQIGREMGVSGSTIQRRLVAAGCKPRNQGATLRLRREREIGDLRVFFDRYKAGEGYCALAEEAGVDKRQFRRLLEKSGITVRPQRATLALRNAALTVDERRQMTTSANAAKRGRPATEASLERRAITMQNSLGLASRADLLLAVWLAERGERFTLQKAVGRYNIDIAIHEPLVAVEVDGFHHKLRNTRSVSTPAQRREYLLDRGWRMITVFPPEKALHHLRPVCADRIVALLQEARLGEPSWGQYCMIRGNGDVLSGGESEG